MAARIISTTASWATTTTRSPACSTSRSARNEASLASHFREGLAVRRGVPVLARLGPAARLGRETPGDRGPGEHLEVAEPAVDEPVVGRRRGQGQARGLGGDPPRLAGAQVGRGDHHLRQLPGGERGQPAADRRGLRLAELGQRHLGVPAAHLRVQQALRVGGREGHIGQALSVPYQDQFIDDIHWPTLSGRLLAGNPRYSGYVGHQPR